MEWGGEQRSEKRMVLTFHTEREKVSACFGSLFTPEFDLFPSHAAGEVMSHTKFNGSDVRE